MYIFDLEVPASNSLGIFNSLIIIIFICYLLY